MIPRTTHPRYAGTPIESSHLESALLSARAYIAEGNVTQASEAVTNALYIVQHNTTLYRAVKHGQG